MKILLICLAFALFPLAGCATLSGGADSSAGADARRRVEYLEGENARLNRELQNLRLESERLKEREASLGREVEASRGRAGELERQISENEERMKIVRLRLSETEKRLSEIIAGREAAGLEFKKISDEMSSALRGLGLFSVEREAGEARVVLPTVLAFTGAGVRIADGAEPILRALAGALNKHPDKRIVIEGHTDDVPISRTYESNWELSFARALTVLEFLEREGVDPIRMSAAGYGKYRPRASNASASGRAENRRVEVVLRDNQ